MHLTNDRDTLATAGGRPNNSRWLSSRRVLSLLCLAVLAVPTLMLSLPGPAAAADSASITLAAATPTLAAAAPTVAAAAALTPPATIRVYRTKLGRVDVVDFKSYCKHVLAAEWLPQWPAESLRAGAIAVEEYAWYYVSIGGKWPSLGADVKDDWSDQWYDPAISDPRTDAAVDYIWGDYVLRNGGLFVVQYCGHSSLNAVYRCPIDPARMPQWGTYYLARDKGWNWQQIIHYYWDPRRQSGHHRHGSRHVLHPLRAGQQQYRQDRHLEGLLDHRTLGWQLR